MATANRTIKDSAGFHILHFFLVLSQAMQTNGTETQTFQIMLYILGIQLRSMLGNKLTSTVHSTWQPFLAHMYSETDRFCIKHVPPVANINSEKIEH